MTTTHTPTPITWTRSQSKDPRRTMYAESSFDYDDATPTGYVLSVATRTSDGKAWWTVKSHPDTWTGIMRYGQGEADSTAKAKAAAIAFYQQISA